MSFNVNDKRCVCVAADMKSDKKTRTKCLHGNLEIM